MSHHQHPYHNNDRAIYDATARLVHSLADTRSNDDDNVDLAYRVVTSGLGATRKPRLDAGSNAHTFSAAWKRRIQELSSTGNNNVQQMEGLYHDLVDAARANSESDHLPVDVMTVLTKLTGRRQQQQGTSRNDNNNNNNGYNDKHHPVERNSFSNNCKNSGGTNELSNSVMEFEEQQVLRELLYALQGMDGERIKFYWKAQQPEEEHTILYEGIRVESLAVPSRPNGRFSQLGSGALDALKICGEAGWLCHRIQSFIDVHLQQSTNRNHRASGVVARALASRVGQELQAYHQLVAYWESQCLALPQSKWTLRHLLVQVQRHPTLSRLQILAMLTDACMERNNNNYNTPPLRGGTLLHTLHLHAMHGDSRHCSLVQSLLYHAAQPWFAMLYQWTTHGLLKDDQHEFFVVEASSHHGTVQAPIAVVEEKYMWQEKYKLDPEQIPIGILDPALVEPAFIVGKGINFIRTCLHTVGWTLELPVAMVEDDNKDQQDLSMMDAAASTDENVGTTVNAATCTASSHPDQALLERLGYFYVPHDGVGGESPHGQHALQSRLGRTLQHAERLVHSHILKSLRQDHGLMDHLFALKQFLFHGQGDFFSSLMEGVYAEFGCGLGRRRRQDANTSFITGTAVAGVYHHELVAIMEAALRSTNAKDLPLFCLERLRVEMVTLEQLQMMQSTNQVAGAAEDPYVYFNTPLMVDDSNNINNPHDDELAVDQSVPGVQEDNRTVWDIFMLDYTVPDPLVAIVHDKAMEQYKLVYSFLFGLRKVEYMLNFTWRQSASLQHALQTSAQSNGLNVNTSVGYSHATILLRKIAMTRQAMMHFCVNLKSYCMFEVLEGGWKQLVRRLQHARTLDEAIQAHDQYLEGVCRKSLLLRRRKGKRQLQDPNVRSENTKVEQLFRVILSIATEFCYLQERLFEDALEAADRVAQRRREAEQRMKRGEWGFDNEQELEEENTFFGLADAKELNEVVRLSEAFNECMQTLLQALDTKVNGSSNNNTSVFLDEYMDDESNDISGEEDDIDSLRFLMFQLDNNNYYGSLSQRQ